MPLKPLPIALAFTAIALTFAAIALAVVALTLKYFAQSADTSVLFRSEHHDIRVVTVADRLDSPWSMAFLPDNTLLITERSGQLRIVRDGKLVAEPVAGVPEVWARGQGGLLEVVPHPDFADNQFLYLSYSKPNADGSEATTAVARGLFDGHQLSDVEDIFVAEAWSPRGQHFGSKLAFDADGYLFVTVGDRGSSPLAEPRADHPSQQLSNHQGAVVRLHDDGRVPDDNPFVGRDGALPEIWSHGHRNPQGMVIHPDTNEVWITEHGPQGGDELNLARPGRNYGWPVVGYGDQYGGQEIHDDTHREGMEQPLLHWTPSIATSGLMIYTGDVFTEWRGHLLAGGLAGKQVARIVVAESETGGYQVRALERSPLLAGWARIRDVRQGPDGFVYLVTNGGGRSGGPMAVVRLEPTDCKLLRC